MYFVLAYVFPTYIYVCHVHGLYPQKMEKLRVQSPGLEVLDVDSENQTLALCKSKKLF